MGLKFCQNRSIWLRFRDKHVFAFNAEIQDGRQKARQNDICKMSPVDSAATLRVKNFIEITLSRSVSEINVFLRLTQKFKMAAKSGIENNFCEKLPVDCTNTLWVKNFVKIALSDSVSEINTSLHLMQKFKMAAKRRGKTIFAKSHQ